MHDWEARVARILELCISKNIFEICFFVTAPSMLTCEMSVNETMGKINNGFGVLLAKNYGRFLTFVKFEK